MGVLLQITEFNGYAYKLYAQL